MKQFTGVSIIVLMLAACGSQNIKDAPTTHAPIKSTTPHVFIDLSENDRCLIEAPPSVENKKLSIKPILNSDGTWKCETKQVTYKITLMVKNIKKETKEYTLVCDNQYGLMKDCTGWNAWTNDLGDGPFVIETKGQPEKIMHSPEKKK